MRNWSIFSDYVRYIQHEEKTPHELNIDMLNYRHHKELYLKLKGEERETLDVDFGIYPDLLKSKYLDVYEGVYAEKVYANKFNENSDLGTTYLGQTKMTRDTKIRAEEQFPITHHCPYLSFKIRGSRRSFDRTCYIKVLCSQLHYHGPR